MESKIVQTSGKIEELKEEPDYIEIDIPYNLYQHLRSENNDIQNICRICMSTNNDVLYSLLSDNGDNLLASMLTTLAAVQLSPKDGLPTNVCEQCQTLVVQFYDFKIKCEKSDYILRSVLKGGFMPKEESSDINITIKEDDAANRTEIKEEIEYRTGLQPLQDLSDEVNNGETLNVVQHTGTKRKKIKRNYTDVNDDNKTEIKEEADLSYGDIQYLDDPSDDIDSDEKLHHIQDRGRKRKKKIKIITNGHKILQNDTLLVKKRKSRKHSNCYMCRLCPKVFFKAKTLNIHVKSKHGIIVEERAYPCDHCKASFDSEHDLTVHSALHPKGTSWKCNQCNKEFNSKTTLRRHIQRHMEMKPHCCDSCGKTFTELYALRRHTRVHTGERVEKKHACHICQKRYSASSLLAAHMSRHIDLRPYECATCGKCFLSQRLLRSHMLIHSDRKPYACSYCDKRFRHESTRNTHHRTHTGEKPYVCSVCGKTFIQNSNLTLHMRSHTGERPYSCKMCDRKFSSGSSLKTHERIHTGERPYSCKVCGKTFARKNLSMHMRQHTGERPFPCTTCPKKFATAARLRDHCRIHTGEKPYECSYCSFIFSTRSHLIKHLKTHERPKKTPKRELVIVRKVPVKQNTMENTNKTDEELENITKISDPVENIDKNVTIGLFEDVPLEVNREFILQDDSNIKDVLVMDNCQNNYEINNDVCLNTSNDIVNSDENYTSDVNLVTVNEGVRISASTLEGTTVKLYQLDQSLVQIQSSSGQVTISKITSKMTTNF